MEGPPGEARLIGMLRSLHGFDKVMVVAALGDAQGDGGIPALRNLLAVPQRSVDLRCAALLALAKRAGAEASDVLAAHLTGVPAAVADYAIIGLACVGDDRAWSEVYTKLRRQLDRPPPAVQPREITPGLKQFQALLTIAYLARHLNGSPAERIPRLVATLRSRFDRLHQVEQDWLSEHWPAIAPGGPPPDQLTRPHQAAFRTLVYATQLFGPVH
ncbi:hypothetical protein GA0074696_3918 [Micromonospora purpureochromogenes]|uniref:HEAT repeat-containing protein n=1 Tax=Micromonospora purpureochromogenes TaxID=47872 RepID=A0A1C4Z0U7_9ACTN|nr:hypothetical protein [Micromonospora purpureochromogenes]SCF26580.1 hypothetical protein GA0074696_3918 [Micromonospora purpureochromogenes]